MASMSAVIRLSFSFARLQTRLHGTPPSSRAFKTSVSSANVNPIRSARCITCTRLTALSDTAGIPPRFVALRKHTDLFIVPDRVRADAGCFGERPAMESVSDIPASQAVSTLDPFPESSSLQHSSSGLPLWKLLGPLDWGGSSCRYLMSAIGQIKQ